MLGIDGEKHYQRPSTATFGLREDDLTLVMANAAKQQLENEGYEVLLTRSGPDALFLEAPCGTYESDDDTLHDCNKDLQARVAIARDKKAEAKEGASIVFVSIHTNGGKARSSHGRTQSFYCYDPAKNLADQLLEDIAVIAPPNLSLFKGGYTNCEYGVLKGTKALDIPGSLVEVLYHNDAEDEVLLSIPAVLSQLGGAVAQAVKDYLK